MCHFANRSLKTIASVNGQAPWARLQGTLQTLGHLDFTPKSFPSVVETFFVTQHTEVAEKQSVQQDNLESGMFRLTATLISLRESTYKSLFYVRVLNDIGSSEQGCQIFSVQYTKMGGNISNFHKIPIPNDHKIYQTEVK
jgi:hypothetical protein